MAHPTDQPTALVVGGTGPTGPHVVNGLRERGYRVSIFHRGTHEISEIPDDVEHVHADPFSRSAAEGALEGRRFDVAVVMYGRLRVLAELLAGRVGRFLSVGGAPAYRGFMDPRAFSPAGMPVPVREDAVRVASAEESDKGFAIVRTEESVFRFQPEATHFRYPYVYGPRQPLPRPLLRSLLHLAHQFALLATRRLLLLRKQMAPAVILQATPLLFGARIGVTAAAAKVPSALVGSCVPGACAAFWA